MLMPLDRRHHIKCESCAYRPAHALKVRPSPCGFRYTVWRWWKGGVRPNTQHMLALLGLANNLGLGHLFTD